MTSDKGVVERLQRELAEAQSGHDAARQTFHIMQGAANSLRIRAENAEARIETLERALRLVRDAITAPGMEYYAPSIHVTEGGGIGIDVGGIVFVKPLREWHRLAMVDSAPRSLRIKGDHNDEA